MLRWGQWPPRAGGSGLTFRLRLAARPPGLGSPPRETAGGPEQGGGIFSRVELVTSPMRTSEETRINAFLTINSLLDPSYQQRRSG